MKQYVNILFCEDNTDDLALLMHRLEKSDLIVSHRCVCSADQMRQALQEAEWDLVISDFCMPGFGGYAALTVLKDTGTDIPFILVSGTIGEENAVGMMKAGASDYLMKHNLTRLGEAVKREMEESRIRRHLKTVNALMLAHEKRYRAIFNNSLFGMVLTTDSGQIVEANEAACSLFGYALPEFIELNFSMLFKEQNDCRNQPLESGSRSEESVGFKKNQESFHLEMAASYFVGPDGEHLRCYMLTDISERKNAEHKLVKTNAELKLLSRHLKDAREEERKYMAREIHDQLGQLATAIKIDLDWLNINRGVDDEKKDARFAHALQAVSNMIDTTRKIATTLRPPMIDSFGLIPALQWQCSEYEKLNGITCICEHNFDESALSPEVKTELFRICQEALTNVARHAKAAQVKVSITGNGQSFRLLISDDGSGFDIHQSTTHLGLLGIRERASSINAQFIAYSSIGYGTDILVKFE